MRILPRWLRSKSDTSSDVKRLSVRKLRFIAEQDGAPEQSLKLKWIPILAAHPEVKRAYLALASHGASEDRTVVLCIRSTGTEDVKLVEELAIPFRDTFRTDAHLDTGFLNAAQEAAVSKVCAPFYSASSTSRVRSTREEQGCR